MCFQNSGNSPLTAYIRLTHGVAANAVGQTVQLLNRSNRESGLGKQKLNPRLLANAVKSEGLTIWLLTHGGGWHRNTLLKQETPLVALLLIFWSFITTNVVVLIQVTGGMTTVFRNLFCGRVK